MSAASPEPPDLYPALIGVFCDRCGTRVERDYLVSDDDGPKARFEFARAGLRREGWTCDATGDVCPNCPPYDPDANICVGCPGCLTGGRCIDDPSDPDDDWESDIAASINALGPACSGCALVESCCRQQGGRCCDLCQHGDSWAAARDMTWNAHSTERT